MSKSKCSRCVKMGKLKSDTSTVKDRYFTYGIYDKPRIFRICDNCHKELALLQELYNPKSMMEHDRI